MVSATNTTRAVDLLVSRNDLGVMPQQCRPSARQQCPRLGIAATLYRGLQTDQTVQQPLPRRCRPAQKRRAEPSMTALPDGNRKTRLSVA
jgi:hypothetical protein